MVMYWTITCTVLIYISCDTVIFHDRIRKREVYTKRKWLSLFFKTETTATWINYKTKKYSKMNIHCLLAITHFHHFHIFTLWVHFPYFQLFIFDIFMVKKKNMYCKISLVAFLHREIYTWFWNDHHFNKNK